MGLARCLRQVGAAGVNQPSEPDPGPKDPGLPSRLEFIGLLTQLRAIRLLPKGPRLKPDSEARQRNEQNEQILSHASGRDCRSCL